jgi:predicted 3-demethylubiquinone-9 3-methyltransferase (glyoxalase superfamily)
MTSIAPLRACLWFNDTAREAMEYYVETFPNSRITAITEYPPESLDSHFAGMTGKVLNGQFTLNGVDFVCLDGGPLFPFTNAISFVVNCADQGEIDSYWAKLSHDPEAEQCGWCRDRFGVSWQIIPSHMGDLINSPAKVQTMMGQKKIVIQELIDA